MIAFKLLVHFLIDIVIKILKSIFTYCNLSKFDIKYSMFVRNIDVRFSKYTITFFNTYNKKELSGDTKPKMND